MNVRDLVTIAAVPALISSGVTDQRNLTGARQRSQLRGRDWTANHGSESCFHDLDSHNTVAFQSWADDAYEEWSEEEWPVWSAEYDEQHKREFESAAYDVWETEKVDRLREVEWIILPS